MLSAGLFDPLVHGILRVAKGDPLRVLVGTAILAAAISVDGDGSTTTMIVCSAMIPVYKKLNMKMLDLLIIMANSIMNLLPWGGPSASGWHRAADSRGDPVTARERGHRR